MDAFPRYRLGTVDEGGVRLRIGIAVVAGLAVVWLAVQQLALGDLRRIEQDYIAAREPTACATQGLLPFAFGDLDEEKLDATLLELTRQARDESARLRDEFEERSVVPFPPLRSARNALEDSLVKQVALYDAMLDAPNESNDELRALGLANTRFERRVQSARNLLFVGDGKGWSRRFVCDTEPP